MVNVQIYGLPIGFGPNEGVALMGIAGIETDESKSETDIKIHMPFAQKEELEVIVEDALGNLQNVTGKVPTTMRGVWKVLPPEQKRKVKRDEIFRFGVFAGASALVAALGAPIVGIIIGAGYVLTAGAVLYSVNNGIKPFRYQEQRKIEAVGKIESSLASRQGYYAETNLFLKSVIECYHGRGPLGLPDPNLLPILSNLNNQFVQDPKLSFMYNAALNLEALMVLGTDPAQRPDIFPVRMSSSLTSDEVYEFQICTSTEAMNRIYGEQEQVRRVNDKGRTLH